MSTGGRKEFQANKKGADPWLTGSLLEDRPPPDKILPFWKWECQRRDFRDHMAPWYDRQLHYRAFYRKLRTWGSIVALKKSGLGRQKIHAVICVLDSLYYDAWYTIGPKGASRKDWKGRRFLTSPRLVIRFPTGGESVLLEARTWRRPRGRPSQEGGRFNRDLFLLASLLRLPGRCGTDWRLMVRTVQHFTARHIVDSINSAKIAGGSLTYAEDALRNRVKKFRNKYQGGLERFSSNLRDQVSYSLDHPSDIL